MMITCAIIGTGPAALCAASILAKNGIKPVLFEKRQAPGWKLLVAGSSGLNISYECPEDELAKHYPERQSEIADCLKQFPRESWLELLRSFGEEPYLGSSKRYFLKSRTAASLLKAWREQLESAGAEFRFGEELVGISGTSPIILKFASGKEEAVRFALLALGGGSWEETPPDWPKLLESLGLHCKPLTPSNAGYSFSAPLGFFEEAEGKPIKGLTLKTARGTRQGELMITSYGLEGTPIYTVGCPGPASMDLKPDLGEEKLAERLAAGKGSMESRLLNAAKLSPGALLLLKALAPRSALEIPAQAAKIIKNLPIELLNSRPLGESISARGGLSWDELDEYLEVKKVPGLFVAGEMVDWDAPTGGFLIQACVSMGFVAAKGILRHVIPNSELSR